MVRHVVRTLYQVFFKSISRFSKLRNKDDSWNNIYHSPNYVEGMQNFILHSIAVKAGVLIRSVVVGFPTFFPINSNCCCLFLKNKNKNKSPWDSLFWDFFLLLLFPDRIPDRNSSFCRHKCLTEFSGSFRQLFTCQGCRLTLLKQYEK